MTEIHTSPRTDQSIGQDVFNLIEKLFPHHRAQTGQGVRDTFHELENIIPLDIVETPSQTSAFGWKVPDEWSINDAFIAFNGERIVDYKDSNLHLVNGSVPIQSRFELSELEEHLHVGEPNLGIPYRTTFFRDHWGFCITDEQWNRMQRLKGPFEVCIDSQFDAGSLTHAECTIQGKSDDTFLIWSHTCHPSLANDNLSGNAVATFAAKALSQLDLNYTYKFLFGPATIGPINWLANHRVDHVVGGLVLSLLGDPSEFHYKRSRQHNATIDRVVDALFQTEYHRSICLDFDPFGYDERQFCSAGLNLPVGRLTRSTPETFPEYHTSFDNLDLVKPDNLAESLELLLKIISTFDRNSTYQNLQPNSEPFLQPYDLYQPFGDNRKSPVSSKAVIWVLNMSDGTNDLVEITRRSGLTFDEIYDATLALERNQLIEVCQ